ERKLSFNKAKEYCEDFGERWRLPKAKDILSLVTKQKNENFGYINPIFNDNELTRYWSSTGTRLAC
ncbi:MAG: DUF1566 domain-containing protein, partial [Pseudomonadales bacterium]|nr:DUF1566 domain-containing protein [Pseudomonadales bacterium]